MSKPPIKRVSPDELRKMFNDGEYWEKVKEGTLRAELRKSSHPSSPRARVPFCTRSQYLVYVDNNGKKVAGVHQYRKPDGKLGASGRPDPKELFIKGTLYIADT